MKGLTYCTLFTFIKMLRIEYSTVGKEDSVMIYQVYLAQVWLKKFKKDLEITPDLLHCTPGTAHQVQYRTCLQVND